MQNFKALFKMIYQVSYILSAKQKRKSILLFIVVFVGSFMELLGVASLIPFLGAIIDISTLKDNVYFDRIIRLLNLRTDNGILIFLTLSIIFLYCIKNAYLVFQTSIKNKFRFEFQKDISERLLKSYLNKPYIFFLSVDSSEIIRSVGNDVGVVFDVYNTLFSALSNSITLLSFLIIMIRCDVVMTISFGSICLFSFGLNSFVFKKVLKNASEMHRKADIKVNQIAYQAVNSIKQILVIGRERNVLNNYSREYETRNSLNNKVALLSELPSRITELLVISTLLMLIVYKEISGQPSTEYIARLASFALIAVKTLPQVSNLTSYVSVLIFDKQPLEKTYLHLHEVNSSVRNDEEKVESANFEFTDSISLNNVSWKYPDSNKYIFQNINLEIKKGQSVAFIGASGSGKTTLVDMLLGLLQPQSGHIFVDGKELSGLTNVWKKVVGYVPQDIYLIDDTIRRNIAFSIEDEFIDDEQIWKTLQKAQLEEFVIGLPNKLDTTVGERGVKLSGGQRQRIAIARALYSSPQIIVFDEATSALDVDTENVVMKSIEQLYGEVTMIIVAHRLSTIEKCDVVYEVKDGSICRIR